LVSGMKEFPSLIAVPLETFLQRHVDTAAHGVSVQFAVVAGHGQGPVRGRAGE
jgi:hypothetical protein